jgi:hypothetical protein
MNRILSLLVPCLALGMFATVPAHAQNIDQSSPTTSSAVQKNIELKTAFSRPSVPLQGTIKAYKIEGPENLTGGYLADGYLGDLVLENDVLKAVIRKPDGQAINPQFPGNLIDVVHKKAPADSIEMFQVVADLESTAVQTVIDSADDPFVTDGTTASIVIRGHVVRNETATTDSTQWVNLGVDVVTTWSLAKDSDRIDVATALINKSTAPIDLAPGDVMSWGEAGTFVEQLGPMRGEAQIATNWVAGVAEDFSATYYTSSTKQMIGYHTPKFSIIRSYDSQTTAPRPDMLIPPTADSQPSQRSQTPALQTPVPQPLNPTNLPASVDPRRNQMAPLPVVTPSTAPVPETEYSPQADAEHQPRLAKGGGDADSTATLTGATAEETTTSATDQGRFLLAAGATHIWQRHLVISDRDFSRGTNQAWADKQIPTGIVTGIIMEQGTERPLPGAEIRVMGGAGWTGQFDPRPVTRVISRDDGQYALRLPVGNYLISAAMKGRTAVSPMARVSVKPNEPPMVAPFLLGPQTFALVMITHADDPTSTPIPAKVTLIPKPGTEPVEGGFGPSVANGVKNVFYAWRGTARIPVTPGRYRIIVSRGIEYDIYQNDMDIVSGSHLEVPVALKKVINTTGMMSVDAGVLTSASAASMVTPRDRIMMAACEGVSVLVSGDYNIATDLQAAVDEIGLTRFVKAFKGIRFLASDGDMSANILLYPLSDDNARKAEEFGRKNKGIPPDIFLSDLRREFPDCIIQIDKPLDSQMGYLTNFPFDDRFLKFEDQMPPPDFDALQIVDGKRFIMYQPMNSRYAQLAAKRTDKSGGGGPLSPVASSISSLPHGEEVGSPRMYMYTPHDTLPSFTADDLVKNIRAQSFLVTNGPFIKVRAMNPVTGLFDVPPGSVVDLSTTNVMWLQSRVEAASWVAVTGIHFNLNGLPKSQIEVAPSPQLLRYPVRVAADADKTVIYPERDTYFTCFAFSTRRSLAPVIPDAPEAIGGEVYPFAWTGPIFVDKDGNGVVNIEPVNLDGSIQAP